VKIGRLTQLPRNYFDVYGFYVFAIFFGFKMMKKRKIFSPYYDFKTFDYKNPYAKPVSSKESSSRGKKTSSSAGNRSLKIDDFDIRDRGDNVDCCESSMKSQDVGEDFSSYQELDRSSKACQASPMAPLAKRRPRRVSSQNFLHIMSKR
jgi:hypothetical protein